MARRSKTRPRRADSFFGIHIDLHPTLADTQLGAGTSEALVRKILRAARPDYIQYDCKGHPGVLGYPDSSAGPSAPGISNDALGVYRKVTAEHGVALLVHFSGLCDEQAVQAHPAWAAVQSDGTPDESGSVSVFSPYVSQVMIPQMREIIDRYDVDGFWVDGECWAVRHDYRPEVRQRFAQIMGNDQVPAAPGELGWFEWVTLHREQFFTYLKTYVEAIRAHQPGVEIASNWLYSPTAPEPVLLPMDFISGDLSSDAVNRARCAGRYLSSVGLPWDLMAWSFVAFPGRHGAIYKTPLQLRQEAAQVLALGGGFQLYFKPQRDGSLADWQLQLMQQVAQFCHQRREICHRSQTVPQVALLLDTTSHFSATPRVYWPKDTDDALQGMLHAALESGHSADVLADHHLPWQQDGWPVIVVPEWEQVPTGVVHELVEYARRGGSLLITGARTAGLFREHLGVSFDGEPQEQEALLHVNRRVLRPRRDSGPGVARVNGLWQRVTPLPGKEGAKVLATRTAGYQPEVGAEVAATLAPLGQGKIAAIYGPVGKVHLHTHTPWLRDLIGGVLDLLYQPRVRLEGPLGIELVVREKAGRMIIHLLDMRGAPTATRAASDRYFFLEALPPTAPLTLRVRADALPRRVTLEPGGKRLPRALRRPELVLEVPDFRVHAAVVIEWPDSGGRANPVTMAKPSHTPTGDAAPARRKPRAPRRPKK